MNRPQSPRSKPGRPGASRDGSLAWRSRWPPSSDRSPASARRPAIPASASAAAVAGQCASNLRLGNQGSINGTRAAAIRRPLRSSTSSSSTSRVRCVGPSAAAVTEAPETGRGPWEVRACIDNRLQLTAPWAGYTFWIYEFLVNQQRTDRRAGLLHELLHRPLDAPYGRPACCRHPRTLDGYDIGPIQTSCPPRMCGGQLRGTAIRKGSHSGSTAGGLRAASPGGHCRRVTCSRSEGPRCDLARGRCRPATCGT